MGGLSRHVALVDDKGVLRQFGPGDDVPEWARKRITNPKVWGEDYEPEREQGDGPPPRAGKGSGEDKWRAYAAEKGVDVSDAPGRDDVIAALEAVGVPVE